MRQLLRALTLLSVLLCAAAPAVAATSSDFYTTLLQRGISSFDGERYADASRYLKLAAFGLVDSIDKYETAQVYLTLTYEHLNDIVKARDAAHRVVIAERIERRFATINLPANIARAFDSSATKLIGSADTAFLHSAPAAPSTPSQQPRTQPRAAESRPQQTTTAPVTQNPQPAPKPQPTTSKPPQVDSTRKPPVDKPADKPVDKPVEKPADKPVTQPIVEKPPIKPPAQATQNLKPIVPAPAPPSTTPAAAPKTLSPQEASNRIAAGERALSAGQLIDARKTYRSLIDAGVARDVLIRAAEGLYRARDFEGSLAAFGKAGALRRGEEPYHYYMAVAYYETGQIARAKNELAAALPFIEVTPDVARYRTKIESAVD